MVLLSLRGSLRYTRRLSVKMTNCNVLWIVEVHVSRLSVSEKFGGKISRCFKQYN